ncbi:hypothetical protein BGZ65_000108, partial [Modicella reniformis]
DCMEGGWLKRGPEVIATTAVAEAYQTAETIIVDWTSAQSMLNNDHEPSMQQDNRKPVLETLHSKGRRTEWYADWEKIDWTKDGIAP